MRTRRKGFTLIEVVVALGVSAVVLGAAAVSLDAVIAGERRSTQEADHARQSHRLETAFGDDVKHMRVLQGDQPFALKSGRIGDMEADVVSFTRSGSMQMPAESDAAESEPPYAAHWVAYACRAEGNGLTLFRVETKPQSTQGVAVPVLRGISEFSVVAVGSGTGGTLDKKDAVPHEVRVHIVFADGGAAGFGCFPSVTDAPKGSK